MNGVHGNLGGLVKDVSNSSPANVVTTALRSIPAAIDFTSVKDKAGCMAATAKSTVVEVAVNSWPTVTHGAEAVGEGLKWGINGTVAGAGMAAEKLRSLPSNPYLARIVGHVKDAATSTPAKVAAVAAVTGAAVNVGAPVILTQIGFSAAGVKAGSMAAAWHSSIGNVVGGSLFASCQSAGCLGVGLKTAVVGGTGGATLYEGWRRSKL